MLINLYALSGEIVDWSIQAIEAARKAYLDVTIGKDLNARVALTNNIMTGRIDLLIFTPEAKGMVLYQLTKDLENIKKDWQVRHQPTMMDLVHQGLKGIDGGSAVPSYADHEKCCDAILKVLYSLQTKREWHLVMNRINEAGTSAEAPEGQEPGVALLKQYLSVLRDSKYKVYDEIMFKFNGIYPTLADENDVRYKKDLINNSRPEYFIPVSKYGIFEDN